MAELPELPIEPPVKGKDIEQPLPGQPPKLYTQCVSLYQAMLVDSAIRIHREVEYRTWSGSIVAKSREVGIPPGSYSVVMKKLTTLECITVLIEGRMNQPSVIALLRSPSVVEWTSPGRARSLTGRRESAMLTQSVRDIVASLGGLNIKQALITLQTQIEELKDEVESLKKEINKERTVNGKSTEAED